MTFCRRRCLPVKCAASILKTSFLVMIVSFSVSAQENSPPTPSSSETKAPPADSDQKQPDTTRERQRAAPANVGASPEKQQPKRILGIMPNFRAVSAGALPPPPTPRQAFK